MACQWDFLAASSAIQCLLVDGRREGKVVSLGFSGASTFSGHRDQRSGITMILTMILLQSQWAQGMYSGMYSTCR